MRDDTPSRTAIGMAVHRAAHQRFDQPPVFEDPYAERVLGPTMRAMLETNADRWRRRRSPSRYLRAMLAARSRAAEEALALAVQRGVRQYVVLGAGLDTFALRNANPELRVFEVDHPSTQQFKRELLGQKGITPPATLRFVSVDFQRQELRVELQRAGLDPNAPTFFSWLGVIMYLERDAILATLRAASALAGDSGGIAFDFIGRPKRWDLIVRLILWFRGRRVARLGEPFRTFLTADEARQLLREGGFSEVVVLDPAAINARWFAGRTDGLQVARVSHVALATNGPPPL